MEDSYIIELLIGKGEMARYILCDSAIETTHVHYGSFLLFLSQFLQGF